MMKISKYTEQYRELTVGASQIANYTEPGLLSNVMKSESTVDMLSYMDKSVNKGGTTGLPSFTVVRPFLISKNL